MYSTTMLTSSSLRRSRGRRTGPITRLHEFAVDCHRHRWHDQRRTPRAARNRLPARREQRPHGPPAEAADAYRDYLEVHGLSVQLTEALTEYWHQRVRAELVLPDGTPVAAQDGAGPKEFFDLEFRGCRYGFGYPACPDLSQQQQVMRLLEPERIGVTLSEEFQLEPEQSTSALISHHPEATYFNAR